ncbi:glutaredoxin-like protein C5orf63 homolog [Phlebotomus argentipes]|uniref:glutaredoxin-like protein C5orf63 homolog n=1 Tax=Phlebotomus argentipes TaxID=94469 RepID=UPI0028933399|nr:glutaredoxin-like protein C5orf63 homolog [Phlebotomus argentipes]
MRRVFPWSCRRHSHRGKPTVTLFSTEACTLCHDVVQELQPFQERIELEVVDIGRKENVRFLRLYRYDIPVIFLNGEFISEHRLNLQLFRRKLEEFELYE